MLRPKKKRSQLFEGGGDDWHEALHAGCILFYHSGDCAANTGQGFVRVTTRSRFEQGTPSMGDLDYRTVYS